MQVGVVRGNAFENQPGEGIGRGVPVALEKCQEALGILQQNQG